MTQHNKPHHTEKQVTEQVPVTPVITTEPDTFSAEEIENPFEHLRRRDSVRDVALTMAEAAKGGAFQPVADMLQRCMPDSQEEASKFVDQIRRLGLAATQAVTAATEMYWNKFR